MIKEIKKCAEEFICAEYFNFADEYFNRGGEIELWFDVDKNKFSLSHRIDSNSWDKTNQNVFYTAIAKCLNGDHSLICFNHDTGKYYSEGNAEGFDSFDGAMSELLENGDFHHLAEEWYQNIKDDFWEEIEDFLINRQAKENYIGEIIEYPDGL